MATGSPDMAPEKKLHALWLAAAALLVGVAATATWWSPAFAPPTRPADMPILAFVAAFVATSLVALALIPLVRATARRGPSQEARTLAVIVVAGLAARLVLLASEPILEVDYNRYLWDGLLTLHGFNPYATAPADVIQLLYVDLRLELSKSSTGAFERISYPELRTIYPPVAQAAFAGAAWLAPWSLTAWRAVIIGADIATLALIIALLDTVGRSRLWCALYWWSPLVLKELVNSAHMEAVLLPTLLGAVWLAARGRPLAATMALGLAIATKLWPLVLVPLVLRPLLGQPMRLALALFALAIALAGTAIPIWSGGIDDRSGFVSFAQHWSTNSALFPVVEKAVAWGLGGVSGEHGPLPGRIARSLCALIVFAAAVLLSWRPVRDASDVITRAYAIITVLLLLSPAQFPWYVLWVLPLAVLVPGTGWHIATASMPLYYAAFHVIARDAYDIYETWLLWLVWLPIWIALARDWLSGGITLPVKPVRPHARHAASGTE